MKEWEKRQYLADVQRPKEFQRVESDESLGVGLWSGDPLDGETEAGIGDAAFRLPCRLSLHTVGSICWMGGTRVWVHVRCTSYLRSSLDGGTKNSPLSSSVDLCSRIRNKTWSPFGFQPSRRSRTIVYPADGGDPGQWHATTFGVLAPMAARFSE